MWNIDQGYLPALQIAEKRKTKKGNAEFQRIAQRNKKASLGEQSRETGKQWNGKDYRALQENYIGKNSDAGMDWGQEEKGMTEDEMARWHHQLDGHGFG